MPLDARSSSILPVSPAMPPLSPAAGDTPSSGEAPAAPAGADAALARSLQERLAAGLPLVVPDR
jgi:hypothetical protein